MAFYIAMVKYTMECLKRLKKANKHIFRASESRHYEHENTNTKSIAYIAKNMFIAFIAFILKIANSAKNAFIAKNCFRLK